MAIIVQKYGGTSVKDIEHIQHVADRVKQSYSAGNDMIVVVSARAGMTNNLLKMATSISSTPSSEELDMLLCIGEQETAALLAIALQNIGIKATARLGYQIGIHTCDTHGNARIHYIDGGDIEELLNNRTVVVVAGFQGISDIGRLTTLGRGGSDLTALALAHRFHADHCEIFTDVDGVFTGDPNTIQHARLIPNIDFESLLRLSFFDNKIMQDRSIAFAQKHNISFSISHSKHDCKGTFVTNKLTRYEDEIIGITSKTGLSLLTCNCNNDCVNMMLSFFQSRNIPISFIKHRKISIDNYVDELCLQSEDFLSLQSTFFDIFSDNIISHNIYHDLSRIDIVGTNIQCNQHLPVIFDIMKDHAIVRSEYGKHGLSFLINTAVYKQLVNSIHDIIFCDAGKRSHQIETISVKRELHNICNCP